SSEVASAKVMSFGAPAVLTVASGPTIGVLVLAAVPSRASAAKRASNSPHSPRSLLMSAVGNASKAAGGCGPSTRNCSSLPESCARLASAHLQVELRASLLQATNPARAASISALASSPLLFSQDTV